MSNTPANDDTERAAREADAVNSSRRKFMQQGALLGGTVPCPVIGEIPRQKCVEHQRSRHPMTNPTRAALSLACPTCPHNLAAKRGTGAAR